MAGRQLAIGIDVGGTFTDVTLVEPARDLRWTVKVPSTPDDPSRALLSGLEQALELAGATLPELVRLVHGTTVATNAILQHRPTRLALVTTAGFRHVLEIGRHDIPPGENYWGWIKPERPIAAESVFEVPERILASGRVLRALDEAAVRRVAADLRALGVESIAICLLHAWANPDHERRTRDLLAAELPGVLISISSEVMPEIREYERGMATALNAYVRPHVGRYLTDLVDRLDRARNKKDGQRLSVESTRDPPFLVMKSNGGVASAETAATQAIQTILSGPAAGVVGAARVAVETGFSDLISIDVGGTSADVCLVRGGQPSLTNRGQIAGHTLHLPVLDITTIGAGGGSLAQLVGGRLRVGPESAGASPGPVCYGQGGLTPTVTDAHLVLGRLAPELLSGRITLDVDAARRAIDDRIATQLGLSIEGAAAGIIEIANNNMLGAIRTVSVERGLDPRGFVLVPFGGAGPLHGLDLAALIGIRTVVVPRMPGVLSTHGLLNTHLQDDLVRTHLAALASCEPAELNGAFEDLEAAAQAWLAGEGVVREGQTTSRAVDLRYAGQNSELRIEIPTDPLDEAAVDELLERFHAEHERQYTYALPNAAIELVNLRVSARGQLPGLPTERLHPHEGPLAQAQRGQRTVYFGADGWLETPVYDRGMLGAGVRLDGPAAIEQLDSTTILSPGQRGTVESHGHLIVELE